MKTLNAHDIRIAIVGTGRFAHALARSIRGRISLVIGRTLPAARELAAIAGAAHATDGIGAAGVNVIWIVTSDHAISEVAAKIARERTDWRQVLMVHSAGAIPLAALDAFRERGGDTMALHPNLSLTGTDPIPPQAYWSVASSVDDPERTAGQLLSGLEPHLLRIDERHRALYHAAAVAAGNFTVTLFAACVQMYVRAGLDPQTARAVVHGFMSAAVERVGEQDPADVITGPVVRGDAQVVAAHVDAVSLTRSEAAQAFAALARLTAALFAPEHQDAIERMLEDPDGDRGQQLED
jgi:predicted short-subunit dehydrogenase-like oxidoreductase (DUF2520 family)